MKTSEIALTVALCFFSILISYWVSSLIVKSPSDKFESIEYATEIKDSVAQPDSSVFNPYAMNPTVEVHTGTCSAGQYWDDAQMTCVTEKTEEDENSEKKSDSEKDNQNQNE